MRVKSWTIQDRHEALDRAGDGGVELLVIGGGINGAAVARDAAHRGLRTLLVERDDFAAGTSGASSKLLHGGLRYLGQGELALAREASRERELLMRNNASWMRAMPFFIAEDRGAWARLRLRMGLWVYALLAREPAAAGRVAATEITRLAPPLALEVPWLGFTREAPVDDARLVLDTLKNARRHGAEAVNHCEARSFDYSSDGRLSAVRLFDRLRGRSVRVRLKTVINTTGVEVDRVRSLDVHRPQGLRPSRGTHIVLSRRRLPLHAAIGFRAEDGRFVFAYPRDDAVLVGTTDAFVTSDDRRPYASERDYLLRAVNRAFALGLCADDVWSTWTGIRPLLSPPRGSDASAASRDARITVDRSGLVSMTGGKLTTHRAVAERLVTMAVAQLAPTRRAQLRASRTDVEPLRDDARGFDEHELAQATLPAATVERLKRHWGAGATCVLGRFGAPGRRRIGETDFFYAEVAWAAKTEAPASLCDLLERRVRLAPFTPGGSVAQAEQITAFVAPHMRWDAEECRRQVRAYRERILERYRPVERSTGEACTSFTRAPSRQCVSRAG